MSAIYNIYCDESCHLEHDGQSVMVLGAVWCLAEKTREIALNIREIKLKHGLPKDFETKWTKVSQGKIDYYLDLVDYFFYDDNLHFRALVIPEKNKLRHDKLLQTHDTWYYKMYFDLLKVIFNPHDAYNVYLDIKDTRSGQKVAKLHDVLCNNAYDFERKMIEKLQIVRSNEVEQIQLADLLIGAVGYVNRGLKENSAKVAIVKRIQEISGYNLMQSNLLRETKVNIFIWQAVEL
jgi:Protein of unknown function (DUF3800)